MVSEKLHTQWPRSKMDIALENFSANVMDIWYSDYTLQDLEPSLPAKLSSSWDAAKNALNSAFGKISDTTPLALKDITATIVSVPKLSPHLLRAIPLATGYDTHKWRLLKEPGEWVNAGETIAVLESMPSINYSVPRFHQKQDIYRDKKNLKTLKVQMPFDGKLKQITDPADPDTLAPVFLTGEKAEYTIFSTLGTYPISGIGIASRHGFRGASPCYQKGMSDGQRNALFETIDREAIELFCTPASIDLLGNENEEARLHNVFKTLSQSMKSELPSRFSHLKSTVDLSLKPKSERSYSAGYRCSQPHRLYLKADVKAQSFWDQLHIE